MVMVLALLSSAILGSADFVGGMAARRARATVVVVWSNAAGLLSAIAIVGLLPGRFAPADVGWGLLAGLCGTAGAVLLYRALAVGVMSVLAPTTAAASALLPGVAGLLRGEEVTATAGVGIAAALGAMVLISRRTQSAVSDGGTRGMGSALLAGVSFGGFLVALAHTGAEAAGWPLVFARCASLPVLLMVVVVSRVPLRLPAGSAGLALLSGALDMMSNLLFLLAIRSGHLALTGLLASLSPVGTIGLARILLKERLRAPQQIGAALAMCSVLLLAVG